MLPALACNMHIPPISSAKTRRVVRCLPSLSLYLSLTHTHIYRALPVALLLVRSSALTSQKCNGCHFPFNQNSPPPLCIGPGDPFFDRQQSHIYQSLATCMPCNAGRYSTPRTSVSTPFPQSHQTLHGPLPAAPFSLLFLSFLFPIPFLCCCAIAVILDPTPPILVNQDSSRKQLSTLDVAVSRVLDI
ncbi:hypothetical protein O6H91_02G138300 [Diphasiastrum complanatum]|uniref:Uncharacterized protein n=1 Tax=Diphasiastrum complanatum TaxID=34168 RepID=A0ACC2EL60_DIPCM|nr:hypothetical protein O6H91_02G138300 [Diphasiastrum complanatum]